MEELNEYRNALIEIADKHFEERFDNMDILTNQLMEIIDKIIKYPNDLQSPKLHEVKLYVIAKCVEYVQSCITGKCIDYMNRK